MGEAIIISNIISNSSTIRSMKDTVATAGQSKITHLNQSILHITKKSKHLTVKLIKGMMMTTRIPSFQAFKNIWRSNKSTDTKVEVLPEIKSTPMILEETPNVEQKLKKSRTLQTKNIKVITREDILSNRYELDPFYSGKPNSTAKARRSHAITNAPSSSKTKRKSSSNMQRSYSLQNSSRSTHSEGSLPHSSRLREEHRSLSTTQLMTQQEFERRVSNRPSIPSLNHPTRNKSVRFHIQDTEERIHDVINEKEEVYTDAMVYELNIEKDYDPAFLYVDTSPLMSKRSIESDISDSQAVYL